MSTLFGDSPPNSHASLFASRDYSESPSIFDDETADSSAWAGAQSPHNLHRNRSQNLGDVVRQLLTAENADIPPAYYGIYDNLVSEFGDGADGLVEANGAADRVLNEAEVFGDERGGIWEACVGRKDLIGRGEVWCLLAMAGLVQEGEQDIGVDAVDVRRGGGCISGPTLLCSTTLLDG